MSQIISLSKLAPIQFNSQYWFAKTNKAGQVLSRCPINPKSSLESDNDAESDVIADLQLSARSSFFSWRMLRSHMQIKSTAQSISNVTEGEISVGMPEVPMVPKTTL